MKFVIVTGMSGSGKTVALKALEDIGYDCMDNLPVELLPKLVEIEKSKDATAMTAFGIDIRRKESLENMQKILEDVDNKNVEYSILFLDADNETLIKRYKETRRSHPLSKDGRIETGIEKERKALEFLRNRAEYYIDTSHFLTKELRAEIVSIFADKKVHRDLFVNVLSFGFAYGIPKDADLVFDVRFLTNPFYEADLRLKSGEDKKVKEYIFRDGMAEIFMTKLQDMVEFLIPQYVKEGRSQLVIAIGCTGGQHRSVCIACALAERLKKYSGISLNLEHRDCDRNIKRLS